MTCSGPFKRRQTETLQCRILCYRMDEQHQVSDLNELSPLVLLNDEPTPDHEADGLKMRAYAEVISGAALGTIGPFTIGVFGKWGTGKSSILRQAKSLVEMASPDALCVWFNAWQYDHEPHPLVPMALEIAAALDARIAHEKGTDTLGRWIRSREIGVALRAVASGLTIKSPVLDVDLKEILAEIDRATESAAVSPLQPGVSQRAFGLLRDVSTIDAAASGENQRPPIVVFVDDLDRCLPRHALRLLQAIRLVLSQPGFFFVLALDPDPVVHYLARDYEKLGMKQHDACARSYLEKMIQLPLWIPPHESRFSGFMTKLLDREELQHHPDVRGAVENLSDLLKVGTEANPRAVVRLINSLIADRLLWKAQGREVDAEWLGFCAISRVLRDKLGDEPYKTLVYADDSCAWLTEMSSPDELDKRQREYVARGEKLSRPELDELKWLGPTTRSAAVRALLKTPIGERWLKDHTARHAIEGYLASERRHGSQSSSEGISAIDAKIREALSLKDEAPITEAHRTEVKTLDLTFEPLENDDVAYLASMTALTSLNLGATRISDDGLQHLKALTSLTSLNLGDTQISDDGLQHLKALTSLTSLYLWNTQISDDGLQHLKTFTSLTSLNLGDTQISDDGLQHLKALTSLTSLYLWNTQISDVGLQHLKALTSLTSLDLTNTQISDGGLQHLKALTSLTSLDLTNTQISDDGRRALREVLPNAKIR